MMAQKPLLLKDYLELDPNSDSCNSFASFPRRPDSTTVRFLLEAERCRGGARLLRSRSKRNAFTKILNAVKNLPLSSPTRPRPNESGLLLRSISKKLSKSFWKKTKKEDHKVTVKDIVRWNSFELYGERRSLYFPSPVVSSCSSCSEGEEGSESFLSSSSDSSDCFGNRRRNSSSEKSPNRRQSSSEETESQEIECRGCQSEEEKEQLSPVAVMDFPYQDEGDEEEPSSPCFEQSLANIERTTHQLLQKIRRFENLAELDQLDLELRFEPIEDEESEARHVASADQITAWDLIRRLRTTCQVGPHSEKLVADFFFEELSWSASTTNADVGRLLSAARDWINGRGCLKAEEHGKVQLNEMERNGVWRCFGDGKDDVAADVEMGVMGSLLHELVLDLVEMD